MAHQAVMLDDAQKLLSQNRQQTAQHQQRSRAVEQDDMGVHIGDVINQTPAPVVKESLAARPGLLSWLPTVISLASLLGTGGIGYLTLAALRAAPATNTPAVAPAAPVKKDMRIKFWIEDMQVKTGQVEEVKE